MVRSPTLIALLLLGGCFPETPARPDFGAADGARDADLDGPTDDGPGGPIPPEDGGPDAESGDLGPDAETADLGPDASPDMDPPECETGATRQCGRALGVCFIAVQTCVAGRWVPCEGLARQGPEQCNGEDDDCDGEVDDDLPPYETRCGVGACAATGMWRCEGGVASDDCAVGMPADEQCNGIDDDCDGTVDEQVSCVEGHSPCQQGQCLDGACVYPEDGDPCDSALPCGDRSPVCHRGACLCDCGPEPRGARLALSGVNTIDARGVFEFRTVDGRSTGPVACVSDWRAAWEAIALAPPGEPPSRLMEITIHRPCTQAEPTPAEREIIEAVERFDEANSIWHALRLGLKTSGSLITTNAQGAEIGRMNVFDALITTYQPRGRCEDTSTIVLDARQPDRLGLSAVPGQGIGALRVASAQRTVDVAPDLSNWNSADFPHGTPLTLTITNPCGDPGERHYFGSETIWDFFRTNETYYPEFTATLARPQTFYALEQVIFLYMDETVIESYRPGYADCVEHETIVLRGNRHVP